MIPTLETERLLLRGFQMDDVGRPTAPRIHRNSGLDVANPEDRPVDAPDGPDAPRGAPTQRPWPEPLGRLVAQALVMVSPGRTMPPTITFALIPRRLSSRPSFELTNFNASTPNRRANFPHPV